MGRKYSESLEIVKVVDKEELTEKINIAAWLIIAASVVFVAGARIGEQNFDKYFLEEVADKITKFLYKASIYSLGGGVAAHGINALIKEKIKDAIEKIEKKRRPKGYWRMPRERKDNVSEDIHEDVENALERERSKRG